MDSESLQALAVRSGTQGQLKVNQRPLIDKLLHVVIHFHSLSLSLSRLDLVFTLVCVQKHKH